MHIIHQKKQKIIAKNFLHPDTKFYVSKGEYTLDIVVENFISIIKVDPKKNAYFKTNKKCFTVFSSKV